ncbi:MAG: hydantoinase/oxoprolinase family protein [Hyphomicrobiaceae bacterium]
MQARIGVDVGGTFTDVVLASGDGRIFVNKTTTTPADPGIGVVQGVKEVLAEAGMPAAAVMEIVHGTTVASNTILQRTGARTGLLTTAGFRDVLEIGRIRTPGMFDLSWRKPEPLVPRRWRREAVERVAADGSVVTPLDPSSVRAAADFFEAEGVLTVAICFINSYVNPAHENEAAAILAKIAPHLLVTTSCGVLPEIKEYERTSTAVVNAYLLPAMRSYLERLGGRLEGIGVRAPLQVMASNGGMIGLSSARERPVFAVGSGPAGGVTGAARIGRDLGEPDLIVFDMGGTTAKAAIVEDSRPMLVTEYEFRDGISSPSRFIKGAGYMLKVPAIDIAEVGSGGGSIARIDAGGLLQVGPHSAGGDPGPACYGLGNHRPTVTDANLVLGYLNPRALAGGSLPVDPELAREAIRMDVAEPLGIDVVSAAHGIRQVANVSMARAIRAVTVERGRDPRRMSLMAFGGGGPLHAVDVARLLGIRKVIVSPISGVFSAAGMLAADAEHDYVRPVLGDLEEVPRERLESLAEDLRRQAAAALAAEGYATAAVDLRYAADLRYVGQSSELTVPMEKPGFAAADRAALAAAFHAAYRTTYGYGVEEPVEFVNLRLTAIAREGVRLSFGSLDLDPVALRGTTGHREVSFRRGEAPVATRLLAREAVSEEPVPGPAIIESYDTTILVPPGCTARTASAGCIAIEIGDVDA